MSLETLYTSCVAFLIVFISLPILALIAPSLRLLDHPGERKGHREPTPLVGGIALFFAFTFACWALGSPSPLGGGAWLCIAMLFTLGVLDDSLELPYVRRFLGQLFVGGVVVFATGVGLYDLGDLLGTGALNVAGLVLPLTMFAIASGVNSFNLIDGLDGLASGLFVVSLMVLLPVVLHEGLVEYAASMCSLLAATFGFFLFNFPGLRGSRPRYFLGDSGSNILGFIVVYFLIDLSQKGVIYPITALFIFGWPLMDTAAVILRRRLAGDSPAVAGNDHIHHMLMASGLGRKATVISIQVATLIFALLGLALMQYPEPVSFIVYVVILLSYLWLTRRPAELIQHLQQVLRP